MLIGVLCLWTIIFILLQDSVLGFLARLQNPFRLLSASYWEVPDLSELDSGWEMPEEESWEELEDYLRPPDLARVFSLLQAKEQKAKSAPIWRRLDEGWDSVLAVAVTTSTWFWPSRANYRKEVAA
ncbi:hypothetical protein KKG24_04285 [Patescibacteria group bacterium]|nr:hypothetical protein [Patescibacteria group bacterium]